jgi:predicted permease
MAAFLTRIDNLRRDVRYTLRVLRRQPIAAATAVLTLAIGIGLNAAVFSVVDWVLLRPLPYPAAHELVRVFTAGVDPVTPPSAWTHEEFQRLQESSLFRASVAFSTATRVVAGTGTEPIHAVVARVTGDLFRTLAITPELGRPFSATEMADGAPVIILGDQLWRRRFAGDPTVLGRTVTIDGALHTVIGVMSAERGYPRDGDVWRPFTASENADGDRQLNVVGRLQDGASRRADAEIATLERTASKGTRTAWVDNLQRTDVRDVRAALQALLAATALVLVIACANVAALIGSRRDERAGEIAVRAALGASRGRLLAQSITESLVLAAAGGVLGLLLGQWMLRFLVAIAPAGMPRLSEVALDRRILTFGIGVTMLTGLVIGAVPAFQLSRLAQSPGSNRSTRSARESHGRRALVLAQIAIAVVLTTAAGRFARSLEHLIFIDNGFAADRLVAVDLYLRGGFSGDSRQLFRQLIDHASAIPGVRTAAVSMRLPTQVAGLRAPVQIVGETVAAAPAVLRPISREYFDAVGIPLVAGRSFSNSDSRSAPKVAIVNRTFVHDILGDREATDVRVTTPLVNGAVSIVGVVGDVRPAGESDRPALYVPEEQVPIGGGYLVIAALADPRSILTAVAERLQSVAPSLAFDRVRRVAETLEDSRAVTRFSTQLATVFAALALVLSALGVYGLTSGEVSARWKELAVRLALGASPRSALVTVIRPTSAVLATGAALGVAISRAADPALASLLRGVDADDTATLATAALLLVGIGVIAALLAAARVVWSDPAAGLRSE